MKKAQMKVMLASAKEAANAMAQKLKALEAKGGKASAEAQALRLRMQQAKLDMFRAMGGSTPTTAGRCTARRGALSTPTRVTRRRLLPRRPR